MRLAELSEGWGEAMCVFLDLTERRRFVWCVITNMPAETILLFSTKQDFSSRFYAESIFLSLFETAKPLGGVCWAGWLESGVLKVRIQGISFDEIRVTMNVFLEGSQRDGHSISVIERQAESTPLPNVQAGEIPWGTVIRQKLTKKLLKLLPEGAYLLSNLYSINTGEEVFSEHLGNAETRESTWRRAVLAGANNRTCRLVWTETDFNGPGLSPVNVRGPRR